MGRRVCGEGRGVNRKTHKNKDRFYFSIFLKTATSNQTENYKILEEEQGPQLLLRHTESRINYVVFLGTRF